MSKKNLCKRRFPGWFILFSLTFFICGTGWAQPAEPYRFDLDEDSLSGPVDFSDLNQPLGPDARLFTKNGHFYRVGADLTPHTDDDSRVRLFGVNLSFTANFPSQQQAPLIAKRLRKLGFNAVRLHHLDSAPSTATDPPRSLLLPGPYPSFNPEAVNRLRTFIKALSNEGIYINLNLHVGYIFNEDDGVPPSITAGMKRPIGSPIKHYSSALIQKQKTFAARVIGLLDLKQAPNLAMIEISNEASLLATWHRNEWLDAIPGQYYDELNGLWQDWLEAKYLTPEQAARHWGLRSNASWPLLPEPSNHSQTTLGALTQRLLNKWKRTFPAERTVSPPISGQTRLLSDFQSFLADTDQAYFNSMRATLHTLLERPVPVTGTQLSYGGLMNRIAQQDMDYLDEHFYIDHPHYLQGFSEPRDWRIWDVALTDDEKIMEERLLRMAFRRDPEKPFVVSEINHPFPSRQGAETLPLITLFAALQDWDGLFFYDYSSHQEDTRAPDGFSLHGDWGKYANLGQSAQLFRNPQVAPLSTLRKLSFPGAELPIWSTVNAEQALLSALLQHTGLSLNQAWSERIALSFTTSTEPHNEPFFTKALDIPSVKLRYQPEARRLTFSTPFAAGWFGNSLAQPEHNTDMPFQVQTTEQSKVSVFVTTLDQHSVEQTRHFLISVGSATVGSQPGSIPSRPKKWVRHPSGDSSWTLEPDPTTPKLPSGSRTASGPAWLTRTPLHILWNTQSRKATVYPLDHQGKRMASLADSRINKHANWLSLGLLQTNDESSLWYEVILE